MPSLDLAIALGIVRRSSHMRHTAYANKFLEVSSNELWTVVTDNPGRDTRIALACSLDDRLDVTFFHFRADFPVYDRSAVAVEQTAKEEKGAEDVDISNVDVPVLVWTQRLLEPRSFERRLGVVAVH